MECNTARQLIEVDCDGELDLIRHLELEEHLRSCPECSALAASAKTRRTALHEGFTRYRAPSYLIERLRDSVTESDAIPTATKRGIFVTWPIWNLAGMAAILTLALFGGYAWGSASSRSSAYLSAAVSSHVRSLQAGHLLDVTSTDQHTVKPWFVGKLDFSPPVVDLADAGFPLMGGRLEHLGGRNAAALVFGRRQHIINVFVWPSDSGQVFSRHGKENGFNAVSWSHAGLNFAAVSEIPAGDLQNFVEGFRSRTD